MYELYLLVNKIKFVSKFTNRYKKEIDTKIQELQSETATMSIDFLPRSGMA